MSAWARAPVGAALGGALLVLFVLPLAALLWSTSAADLSAGFSDPRFVEALALSVRSTLISLAWIVISGTPLAWWLATSGSGLSRAAAILVDLPIVIPPAVVGVGLLMAFGRAGWLGSALSSADIMVPFSSSAVVLAQIVVAGPFFVQAATNAFRAVDPETVAVARTLGASPRTAFVRVALPIARPGLVAGASLAWARALGEFGATLLFAGNLPGTTQTLPLAIFSALESDIGLAVALSLFLVGLGGLLLVGLRIAAGRFQARPREVTRS